jgi:hypothetical protein
MNKLIRGSTIRHRRRASSRDGIILLVVLGMLTLFSVLAVSYLVFTSRNRAAAISIQRAENRSLDPQPWLDNALEKLLVGDRGPDSSLWGHDLLGDLYGMRDAIQGQLTPSNEYVVPDDLVGPEVLLGEFVRVPTELYRSANYPNRRFDSATLKERIYPHNSTPAFSTDDELAGRILTFNEGPLAGLSMKIVRYFGDHRGATNGRDILTGQLILDLRPHMNRVVTVDNAGVTESHTLRTWVEKHAAGDLHISLLFYDKKAAVPLPPTAIPAIPLSDFYINGRILNGPGLGWDVKRDSNLARVPNSKMNIEERISTNLSPYKVNPLSNEVVSGGAYEAGQIDVPSSLQGHYSTYRRQADATAATPALAYLNDLPPGDADEPYDAPDEQNLWLSYFPIDDVGHLGPPRLGLPTPSFVRPGTLNWLINQEGGTLDNVTTPGRLQQILLAVRRATLRPLPITNDPWMPKKPDGTDDINARADGVLKLDYGRFTGSNSSVLGTPLDYENVTAAQLRMLVRALAGEDTNNDGKPDWDVDNNGDGVPDGVWIDAGIPLAQDENGRMIKPMVSFLVEDLSGRVNVNLAGNLAQAYGVIRSSAGGILYGITPPQVPADPKTTTYTDLPAGFGYGPAEIDTRKLFPNTGESGSLALLSRRLNQQYAGGINQVAAGHVVDPMTGDGNDLRGVLRQPGLPNLHSSSNPQGLPLDKFGRGSLVLGIDGGLMIANTSDAVANGGTSAGDAVDDPYEMHMSPGKYPDRPFTLADLEAILRFDDFDRDALDSELVAVANEQFNTGNVADVHSARKSFANSITTASSSVADHTGVLPQEFRDPSPTTTAGGSAVESHEARSASALLTHYWPGVSLTLQEQNAVLMQILPQSVLSGGKLNLNQPFGNGIDDDGDGAIDDPQELRSAIEVLYANYNSVSGAQTTQTPYSTRDADFTNGVPGPIGANGARIVPDLPLAPAVPLFVPTPAMETPQSLFARHLYVLAMSLLRNTQTSGEFDLAGGSTISIGSPTKRLGATATEPPVLNNTGLQEYRAWQLAQWAINAADYRDPDGIMSRFDYDVFPFDGWDITTIDGSPSFRTVWGMEYPELALEESLAFHDRRVRDTKVDNFVSRPMTTPEKRFEGGSFRDDHPDQWRLPQGSLFLELRSTRSPDYLRVPAAGSDENVAQSSGVPSELYSIVDVGSGEKEYMLNLAKTAPDRNPVWRIAITKAHAGAANRELSGDELIQPLGSDNLRSYNSAGMNRLTSTLQPESPDFFGSRTAAALPTPPSPFIPRVQFPEAIDRVIWFGNDDPDDGKPGRAKQGGGNYPGDVAKEDGIVDFAPYDSRTTEKIFYNRFSAAEYPWQLPAGAPDPPTEVFLRGGQYAVVGPRTDTHVGSLQIHSTFGDTHGPTGAPQVSYDKYESPQKFVLSANGFDSVTFTGKSTMPTVAGGGTANATMRPLVGILAAANPPKNWQGPRILGTIEAIGVNVSEPLPYFVPIGSDRYYDTPTKSLDPGKNFPFDSWYDFTGVTPGDRGALPDEPFDSQGYSELAKVFGVEGQRTGTRERFKTAYLQRLADPTQPYDVELNPYISVDYITIDLTVFNGSDSNRKETESKPPAPDKTEWIDNDDADPWDIDPNPFNSVPAADPFTDLPEAFATRYKTGRTIFTAKDTLAVTDNLSHSVNTFPPQITSSSSRLDGHKPYFDHSLLIEASLDPDLFGPLAPNSAPVRTVHSSTLGFANAAYGERWNTGTTANSSRYAGTPINNWFSSVGWLNRPFVSKGELMWVPTASAATFGARFGTATTNTGFTPGDLYLGSPPPGAVGDRFEFNRTFPHLWNFFSQNSNVSQSLNMHRLLDWVDVPAPFDSEVDIVSTNSDVINRSNVSAAGLSAWGANIDYSSLGASASADPDTWTTPLSKQAWLNGWTVEAFRPPLNIRQPQYRQGRINLNTIKSPAVYRALMAGISKSGELDGAFFNDFINSRRGYLSVSAVPPKEQISPLFSANHSTQMSGAFRPQSVSDIASLPAERTPGPLDKTLMRPGGVLGTKTDEPLFSRTLPAGPPTGIHEKFQQRSVVHHQLPLTRLSNLATDQSNTFAVWITVGLFEVDGNTLSVGNEVGSDVGKVQRYRSFHIIDRSVPVMYKPGELNNATETVLMSRRLN